MSRLPTDESDFVIPFVGSGLEIHSVLGFLTMVVPKKYGSNSLFTSSSLGGLGRQQSQRIGLAAVLFSARPGQLRR